MPNKIVDKRPKSGGEFFNFCQIVLDIGKCSICKPNDHEDVPVYVLVASVACEASGMRILEMLSRVLSSDGYGYDVENNQIRIDACRDHYCNLTDLVLTDGIINDRKIIRAVSAH